MGIVCSRHTQYDIIKDMSVKLDKINEANVRLIEENARLHEYNQKLVHDNDTYCKQVAELSLKIEKYGKIMLGIHCRLTPSSEELRKVMAIG